VQPLAFDARQTDVCVYGDKTGPLDTDPGTIGVCVTGDRTHALRAEGADASEDGTGRGTPIVPIAFSVKDSGNDATVDLAPTLRAGGHTSSHANAGVMPGIAIGIAVRRLTPTECERLQGFPDGHTAIPWKGKPASDCPDGPRYRALGNSMAVNVMRWIGRRIEMVDAL
jgi:DNA (cytosine-5)-methyltransferase 1